MEDYNMALKPRSSLLIYLDKDMCWRGRASGKQGLRPNYSQAVTQLCLTINGLFNPALRKAMGIAKSLFKLAGLG